MGIIVGVCRMANGTITEVTELTKIAESDGKLTAEDVSIRR